MPYISSIEIRFSDIDKFGHVNNAKYLTYLEQARISYFDNVISKDNSWEKTGIILANAEIEFIKPIFFKDKIEIEIAITSLGNKSFEMSYRIFKKVKDSNLLIAKAKTILVCYSYDLNQTISIPENWIKKVKTFENI